MSRLFERSEPFEGQGPSGLARDGGVEGPFRSGSAAAVGTVRGHVRRLIEQPEPLPLVTGLP